MHVIIPPSSILAPRPQPPVPLSVNPAPAAELQSNVPAPSHSRLSEPVAPMLSASAAVAASSLTFNDASSSSVTAAYRASLEAWASYYERVSFEWLQRWGATRDPQALASHELAAQYARGCRTGLTESISNYGSNLQTSYPSSLLINSDSPSRADSSARAVEFASGILVANQQRALAPHVDIPPLAAADRPPQAANIVDPAAPANAVGAGGGAGLLALVVRVAVTMYAPACEFIDFVCFCDDGMVQVHTVVVAAERPHGMGRACLHSHVSHQHKQVSPLPRYTFSRFSALTATLPSGSPSC